MLLGDIAPVDVTLGPAAAAIDITGVTADSRAVERGFLFAALSGSLTHGARFADEALARGASAVLTDCHTTLAVGEGVAMVRSGDPRRTLALMAARFYPRQPATIVAVTGTSGKTSVAAFARQILAAAGRESASIGTIGVTSRRGAVRGGLTTPDPVALHQTLQRLADDGVTDLAVEASSQGLDQRRLDGLRLVAAGFTNLGRDHLDYHADVDAYLRAKLRLFSVILPANGTAVVDVDGPHAADVAAAAEGRGQRVIRVGRNGSDIRITDVAANGLRQRVRFVAFGRSYDHTVPLAGAFQASNAIVAAGLAIAAGVSESTAFAALAKLQGAPGRLELVARKPNGALIFVDYAHKPEALTAALQALRPMAKGRLIVVFGAGGDRDPGKRPLMGRAASENADIVIVTDDNPRHEPPSAIRAAVLAEAADGREIADRGEAIRAAIRMLAPGDVLCVAGKGHETGQIVGDEVMPFSDQRTIHDFMAGEAAA